MPTLLVSSLACGHVFVACFLIFSVRGLNRGSEARPRLSLRCGAAACTLSRTRCTSAAGARGWPAAWPPTPRAAAPPRARARGPDGDILRFVSTHGLTGGLSLHLRAC